MTTLLRFAFTFVAFVALAQFSVNAQYQTIVFDYERNYFNQGQPLPAEDNLILTTDTKTGTELVKVEIYRPSRKHKSPLYETTWKRSFSNTSNQVEVPVNYKLRGGSEYDFVIKTYRKATETEKDNLNKILCSSLDAYVDGIINVQRRGLKIGRSSRNMVRDLNDVVWQGTNFYKNKINFVFPGFSDIIKNKIDQIDNAKLRRARFNVENKDGSRTDARRLFADKLLSELKTALHTEVQQFINSDLLVLDDTKEVNEYPTKKTMNIISVNGGYGGAIFGGGLNDLDYDHAPYVGISFPLGKASLASPFWSKTSLSVGAFLNNFENKAGQTITGPVFQRPYYVGLGYKVFHFIRLNAGATFLEVKKPSSSGGIDLPDLKEVKIRPFVGASAEINLWMNLGSRNVNK